VVGVGWWLSFARDFPGSTHSKCFLTLFPEQKTQLRRVAAVPLRACDLLGGPLPFFRVGWGLVIALGERSAIPSPPPLALLV
jgi:hypothetical protein